MMHDSFYLIISIAGFFEETTTIMETVYEKYRSKTGVGYKNIFGGRAFNLDLDLTPGQLQ